ncbi:MAG: AbrB family transcriptional regulator [Pseudomonadota bacterium]
MTGRPQGWARLARDLPDAVTLRTVALAGAGVAVFALLSLPLPWMLGPMFACLIGALAGMRLQGLPRIAEGMRSVLGVAVGAAITPAVVGRLDEMALSIALLPAFILVVGAVSYPYFHRFWGFDRATSYYAAMPGGLQDMLIYGEEAGADPRRLSLIHVTRVLIVVSALPVLMIHVFGQNLDSPPGAAARELPVDEMVLLAIVAVIGWQGAKAIGMFGASILGPMLLAMAASLADIIHQRPPAEAILAAQFFLGLGVGAKYAGITVAELRESVTAALGQIAMLAAITFAFVEVVVLFGLAPPVEALLAFAPGGQAEMAIIALVAGADVAFVVTHHIIRITVVIIGAPIAKRLMGW